MKRKLLEAHEEIQVYKMREAGIAVLECAKWFNVSEWTIYRALRNARARMGRNEVMRTRKQYARLHLTAGSSQAHE